MHGAESKESVFRRLVNEDHIRPNLQILDIYYLNQMKENEPDERFFSRTVAVFTPSKLTPFLKHRNKP